MLDAGARELIVLAGPQTRRPTTVTRGLTNASVATLRRAIQREVQLEHVNVRFAEETELRPCTCDATSARTDATSMWRAFATRGASQ